MEEIKQLSQTLDQLLKTDNFAKASEIAKQIRIKMIGIPFLSESENILSVEDRIVLRNVLETCAIIDIKLMRFDSFERIMEQLKVCYTKCNDLPKSSDMGLLYSIYLLWILSKNKIIEFSLDIENAKRLLGEDEYIGYVSKMHKSVTDNSFSQLCELQKNPPNAMFDYLTPLLISGARMIHSDSIQSAYDKLHVNELKVILHFKEDFEVIEFVKQRKWVYDEENCVVIFTKEQKKAQLDNDSMSRSVDIAVLVSTLG